MHGDSTGFFLWNQPPPPPGLRNEMPYNAIMSCAYRFSSAKLSQIESGERPEPSKPPGHAFELSSGDALLGSGVCRYDSCGMANADGDVVVPSATYDNAESFLQDFIPLGFEDLKLTVSKWCMEISRRAPCPLHL